MCQVYVFVCDGGRGVVVVMCVGGRGDNGGAPVQAMINQANALGQHVGIYSSASQWNPIMGGSSFASGYPIWCAAAHCAPYELFFELMSIRVHFLFVCCPQNRYPHYDGNPSFSDWSNFGGWVRAWRSGGSGGGGDRVSVSAEQAEHQTVPGDDGSVRGVN